MIIIKILIGLIIGGGLLGYGTYWAISNERKNFNNGMCDCCNLKLRHYSNTSRGDRLYICDKCGKNVFVSYDCVDKYCERCGQKVRMGGIDVSEVNGNE